MWETWKFWNENLLAHCKRLYLRALQMHFNYFYPSFFNWLCLVRCCQIIQHKIFLTVSFLLEHFFHETSTQILRSWLLRTLISEADWFVFQYALFLCDSPIFYFEFDKILKIFRDGERIMVIWDFRRNHQDHDIWIIW